MTEYDYSPDAYEKYLASQQRIARWVDETQKYPPANPFLPSAAGSVTSNGNGGHNNHSSQSQPPRVASPPAQGYVGYRPTPVRTYSTPVTPQPEEDRRSRSRSKTMHNGSSSHHHHHHHHSSSRHRSSHRHSRSSSVTPPSIATPPTYGYVVYNPNTGAAVYPTNAVNAMYPANTTSPVYPSTATSPTIYPSTATSPTIYPSAGTSPVYQTSNTTSPTVVKQSTTQPLVVQTPNGYVIVPPAGRRMEVRNAADYNNGSRHSKKESHSDDVPFFKKIFGFGGLTQSNSRRSKSSHGSRKLRRRDSL